MEFFIVNKLCDGWGGATTFGDLATTGAFCACGETGVLGIGIAAAVVAVEVVDVTTDGLTS